MHGVPEEIEMNIRPRIAYSVRPTTGRVRKIDTSLEYCSITQGLYEEMARCHFNLDTGEPTETFDEKRYEAAGLKLDEHMKICAQCSLVESQFTSIQ